MSFENAIGQRTLFPFSMCRKLSRRMILTIINIWQAPTHGWYCLNTDGATKNSTGLAGCRGLVRDENGRCISGLFWHNYILYAEL